MISSSYINRNLVEIWLMAQGIWEYEKKHLMAGLRWEGLGGSNFCRWEGAPWWEEVGEGAPWRKARQCFGASCACRTAHSASLQSSDHNKPSHSIAIVGDVKNYGEKISLSLTLSPVLCIFGKWIWHVLSSCRMLRVFLVRFSKWLQSVKKVL